jgi:uncharacterized protein
VVRLTAPPVEGEANQALVRFLSRVLRVPPSSVSILRGATGREKVVRVEGLSAAEILNKLDGGTE